MYQLKQINQPSTLKKLGNLLIKLKNYTFGNRSARMHFTVAWNISHPLNQYNQHFSRRIEGCFANYDNVKVFDNNFVIKVADGSEYASIVNNIHSISKGVDGLMVLISPLMDGGRYNGSLYPQYWDYLNKLSS